MLRRSVVHAFLFPACASRASTSADNAPVVRPLPIRKVRKSIAKVGLLIVPAFECLVIQEDDSRESQRSFCDFAVVQCTSGRGGNGCISMLSLAARERAGPDGGDGGNGAHVVFTCKHFWSPLNTNVVHRRRKTACYILG